MARRLAAVVAVGLAGLAALPVRAASPVTVDPAVGDPDTAFHVVAPASFRIRQPGKDAYWFVVHGPGGRSCDGSVTDRVGIGPAGHPRTVSVDLPGVRVVTRTSVVPGPWCPGDFSGHVEFRDWRPRAHRYVITRIGNFAGTVGRTSGG